MKNKLTLTALALTAGFVGSANAQVSFDGTEYTQDFDGLSATATATGATFIDNSTIAGLYVNSEEMDTNSDEYFSSTGSSNGGEVYSFGDDSDRALGYLGSSGNDYFNAAVRLVNTTGSTITALNIGYVGEQWRSGGDSADNFNFLNFSYQTFAADAGSIPADTSVTGWTEVDALDFYAPQADVASGALDGNIAANQESFSESLSLSWAAGDELWIRWTGDNGAGTDAGLAIDSLSIAVPEPSSYALIAGLLGLTSVMLRRRTA